MHACARTRGWSRRRAGMRQVRSLWESEDVSGDGAVARTVLELHGSATGASTRMRRREASPFRATRFVHPSPDASASSGVRTQGAICARGDQTITRMRGLFALEHVIVLEGEGLVFFVDDELFAGYLGGGADVVELRKVDVHGSLLAQARLLGELVCPRLGWP